jgi:integrase
MEKNLRIKNPENSSKHQSLTKVSENDKNHQHEYKREGPYIVCECGRKTLYLEGSPTEGVRVGVRANGRKYSVRDDRSRYFKPQEWTAFINKIKPDKRLVFNMCFNTGGRIEEVMNIRVDDVTIESNNIRLRITKKKAAKGERVGKRREFKVSTRFIKEIRDYIRDNRLGPTDYLFVPTNEYSVLNTEQERKAYMKKKIISVFQMFKRGVKAAGIPDWYNFSLHNIRKTHGMYLKSVKPFARGLDMEEICMRLGHDVNTYLKHYGSPSIFTEKEINQIMYMLGDIYGLQA